MSYKNFIPNVWNETINRDLERLCVFAEDCYRKYEGDVKRKGESVTIVGIGKPTIKDMSKDNGAIDAAETVETTAIVMPIEQVSYFNYEVGDIDKAQAIDGVDGALQAETSEGLSQKVDKYIATVIGNEAKATDVVKVINGETTTSGEKNVLDILDDIQEKLMENDVSDGTEITIVVDPKFFTRFRKEYRAADTDNSKILKNGRVYFYNGMKIKVSNNCAKKTLAGHDCTIISARTKRAVAFVKPLTHSEAYRPEKKFSDAVKGFILYDAKVVRPKELITVPVYYV